MSKKSYDVIFLSLAQNCAPSIQLYFNFLETFPKNFKKKIIIAENNSRDGTRNIISNYSKLNKDVTLLKTDFLNKVEERILRITKGRLFLQKYIIKNKLKSKFVCLIDLDDVLNNKIKFIEFSKILTYLKKNEKKLNGISVKSKPFYYDILSFKCDKFYLPNILELQKSKNVFFQSYFSRKKYIYSVQRKINGYKKLETISSFNGLCVYNYKDFIKGNYLFKRKIANNNIMNEHMNFNISLNVINKKKILIFDDFFLNTPAEHSPPNNIIDFYTKKLKSYF